MSLLKNTVCIKQPEYEKHDEPIKELTGNSFEYWDGSQNFVRQSIFDRSDAIIICVPGLSGHAGTYNFLHEYFSERKISTVGIDLRGFGHWAGKKGDIKNIGLHICDINQIVDYYRDTFPEKKILLLGESLGSSLSLWYCTYYPAKIDGLILTSLVTKKGENDIKFKSIFKLSLGYTFCPSRPVLLDYDPTIYSNDPDFIKWAIEIDTLRSNKVSPRYLLQSNRVINKSPDNLCFYKKPTLLLQGGKDFLSDKKDINKILNNCKQSKIQFEYFQDDHHSLVNDVKRNDVFETMIEWISKNY
jgi:alpha-beta hydrolase superfamily lysophospholipase